MRKLIRFICASLCVCAVVGGAVCAFIENASAEESREVRLITVWQIDSFEGGRGSRAEYLRTLGNGFYGQSNVYVEVAALSSDAARKNLACGIIPDIISYGSGFAGLENYVADGGYAIPWCRGAYCLISLKSSDFTLATAQNTIVNAGKDNLASVAALLRGLGGADEASPTSAYVSLINGEYEYLLGTQRDIIRMQTRNVEFYVEPITCFNDLYQNFSVLANGEKANLCKNYIEYVLSESSNLYKIGLYYENLHLYADSMSLLEGVNAEYTIPPIVGSEYAEKLGALADSGDINMIKNMLKPLI